MKKSIQQFFLERKEQVDFRADRSCTKLVRRNYPNHPLFMRLPGNSVPLPGCLVLIHQIAIQSGLYDVLNSVPVGDSSQNDFGKKGTGITVPGNPVFFLFDKRHAKE